MRPGAFVISLDFELYWGLRDHTPLSRCRDRLLAGREAVVVLLDLFAERGIAATWATVGMLFAEDRAALLRALPDRRPRYANHALDPYASLDGLGRDERQDPFHFAPSLVRRIARTPRQELATHTFSHYYCLEPGQSAEDFEADLRAAVAIADGIADVRNALVFPRNQMAPPYEAVLARVGVRTYRQNPRGWMYEPRGGREGFHVRGARLLDAYAPVAGSRLSERPQVRPGSPVALYASAFLRPHDPRTARLDRLRLRRILSEIDAAAREGRVFHLWWHPHNFGTHLRENVAFLERILDRVDEHRRAGRLESVAMGELAEAS